MRESPLLIVVRDSSSGPPAGGGAADGTDAPAGIVPGIAPAGARIEVVDGRSQRDAAKALHDLGPRWALVKGGHLRSASDSPDLLYDGTDFHRFDAARVDTGHDHGAGDTLAAATACALAHGRPMTEAVAFAKAWVIGCLQAGYPLGAGRGPGAALFRLQT